MMKTLAKAVRTICAFIFRAETLNGLIFCLASVSLAYGLWLLYAEVAFVVMGALFMFLTAFNRKDESK